MFNPFGTEKSAKDIFKEIAELEIKARNYDFMSELLKTLKVNNIENEDDKFTEVTLKIKRRSFFFDMKELFKNAEVEIRELENSNDI